jgi:hypothetical protein
LLVVVADSPRLSYVILYLSFSILVLSDHNIVSFQKQCSFICQFKLFSVQFAIFCCLRYERFVVALEEASRDMLPALKNKSLKVSNSKHFGLTERFCRSSTCDQQETICLVFLLAFCCFNFYLYNLLNVWRHVLRFSPIIYVMCEDMF